MNSRSTPGENPPGAMNPSDPETHEKTGLHAGGAKATDQLEGVIAKL